MLQVFKAVAVFGAGAWGTSLAIKLCQRYKVVNIYLRQENIINEINNNHSNNYYLPNIELPINLSAYGIEDFNGEEELIVMATSSSSLMVYIDLIKAKIPKTTFILIASKGLDYQGKSLFTTSLNKILNNKIGVLAGPNLALEVAMNYPTSTSIAFENFEDAEFVAKNISTSSFIAKPTDDIVSLQVAGCIKNIVAIACGILSGLKYAENTKAWLVVKSLEEIAVLKNFFSDNNNVDFAAPGVVGDIILTSYSMMSRNTKFGFGLAMAKNPIMYLNSVNYLVEGIFSSHFLAKLAVENNLFLPISKVVSDVLTNPSNMEYDIRNLFK